MIIHRLAAAFAVATVVSAGAAAAATTYNAYSHEEGGSPEHSVWFSGGSNPDGSSGPENNHFLFELGTDGYGTFVVDGNTATLTGEVQNAGGDTFTLELYLVESALDPADIGKKVVGGASTADWTYWDLDPNMTSYLTGDLGTFEISLRGEVAGDPLFGQLGTGANDKDPFLFGFSSWITLTEVNCNDCATYHGDINIVLTAVPLPPAFALLPIGLGALGLTRRRRRKPA